MSAFIISDLHTFTIAQFIAERYTEANNCALFAQNLANKLKRINIESVNYRYKEKTPRTKCKPQTVEITDPAKIYRLVRCWIYQSCEDSDNLDFHLLRDFLEAQFTLDEIERSKPLELWSI